MGSHVFDAELFLWEGGDGAWTFAKVPEDMADDIADTAMSGGFGSVRVEVTIGNTTWMTSLFPDSRSGTYVLPIKKAVRQAEGIGAGDRATIRLTPTGTGDAGL